MKPHKVFISYSWDSEQHKEWVLNLAEALIKNGVDVFLDQYDLSAGKEMTYFMEKAMTADKVLVILTPNYKVKADGRQGGVGYEYSMLTKEYYDKEPDKTRIIPILRQSDAKSSCPTFMQNVVFHDMRDDTAFDAKLFEVVRLIIDKPLVKKPPLGSLPNFDDGSIPDIEKAILDFKQKEDYYQKKRSIIDSTQGVQIFIAELNKIIDQISKSLENYRQNFGFKFSINSMHSKSIIFTTYPSGEVHSGKSYMLV